MGVQPGRDTSPGHTGRMTLKRGPWSSSVATPPTCSAVYFYLKHISLSNIQYGMCLRRVRMDHQREFETTPERNKRMQLRTQTSPDGARLLS